MVDAWLPALEFFATITADSLHRFGTVWVSIAGPLTWRLAPFVGRQTVLDGSEGPVLRRSEGARVGLFGGGYPQLPVVPICVRRRLHG